MVIEITLENYNLQCIYKLIPCSKSGYRKMMNSCRDIFTNTKSKSSARQWYGWCWDYLGIFGNISIKPFPNQYLVNIFNYIVDRYIPSEILIKNRLQNEAKKINNMIIEATHGIKIKLIESESALHYYISHS